jgi:hypothetical protein
VYFLAHFFTRAGTREAPQRLVPWGPSNAEWATICTLAGIPARGDAGFRICAKCVRRQREANRYAARAAAEDDERRRSSRPPIGLRLVGVVARQRRRIEGVASLHWLMHVIPRFLVCEQAPSIGGDFLANSW